MGPKKRQKESTPPLPLSGAPQKYQANDHNINAEALAQTHLGSEMVTSVAVSHEFCLVDSVDMLSDVLDTSGSHNSSSPSPWDSLSSHCVSEAKFS